MEKEPENANLNLVTLSARGDYALERQGSQIRGPGPAEWCSLIISLLGRLRQD